MFTEFQVNLVASSLFLTGVAPNVLMAKLAHDSFGYEISWTRWFLAAFVPAAASLAVQPPLLYVLLKPEIRRSEEAAGLARDELRRMGRVRNGEARMLMVFLATLGLWVMGQWTGINATAVALGEVAVLLALRILRWEDVLGEPGHGMPWSGLAAWSRSPQASRRWE